MRSRMSVALVLPCFFGLLRGAEREIAPRRAAPRTPRTATALRVDTNLVLIPVTVTDTFGAPFPGLPKDSFRLFEDGVEQQVKYFSTEDAPLSLGVVFDASRSMEHRLDQSRDAIARFFRASMPGDEFFAVEFSDTARLLCDFTTDSGWVEKSLAGIRPRSWTALLDAVFLAVQHMKHAKNARKALLILSDGADNNSRYTEAETKGFLREADVCVYAIGLGEGIVNRHARLLARLATETGGLHYRVRAVNDLPEAVAKINAAIRSRYVLGYTSSNPANDGMYRRIEVRLVQRPDLPRLRASWRTGYYSVSEP